METGKPSGTPWAVELWEHNGNGALCWGVREAFQKKKRDLGGGRGISHVGVKSVDMRWNTRGEGAFLDKY